jgi:hypothetical protein
VRTGRGAGRVPPERLRPSSVPMPPRRVPEPASPCMRGSFGARLRSLCPQYGHSVT